MSDLWSLPFQYTHLLRMASLEMRRTACVRKWMGEGILVHPWQLPEVLPSLVQYMEHADPVKRTHTATLKAPLLDSSSELVSRFLQERDSLAKAPLYRQLQQSLADQAEVKAHGPLTIPTEDGYSILKTRRLALAEDDVLVALMRLVCSRACWVAGGMPSPCWIAHRCELLRGGLSEPSLLPLGGAPQVLTTGASRGKEGGPSFWLHTLFPLLLHSRSFPPSFPTSVSTHLHPCQVGWELQGIHTLLNLLLLLFSFLWGNAGFRYWDTQFSAPEPWRGQVPDSLGHIPEARDFFDNL